MGWTNIGTMRGPRGPAGIDGTGVGSDVEQDDGKFTLETIQNTKFNGFRFDGKTGRLTVDQIEGDAPIRLPQDGILRSDDYTNWVFTKRTLAFRWDPTKKTHLLMEVS